METKLKSKEELRNKAVAYLEKTSKHLFVINNNVFYKVITFKNNGKDYYGTVMVSKGNITVNVSEVISDRQFEYYTNNSLHVLKSNIFPDYYKTKSIPNFKRFRQLMDEITPLITTDNSKNAEVMKKMNEKVTELELIK